MTEHKRPDRQTKAARRREPRGPSGSTTRRKKLAMGRAIRSLNSAGFSVGRKLVLAGGARSIAVAFPNYIRAQRAQFRMPDEAGIADVFALIALHYAEAELKG